MSSIPVIGAPCIPSIRGIRRLSGCGASRTSPPLPQAVDHAILAVSNERLEGALSQAVERGVKAATIYSSCTLENDTDPPLKQRLARLADTAGIPVCGGNGMGFYSVGSGLFAGIFPMDRTVEAGSISYIAQSGSALSALVHNGNRLGFNLCVSCGNELTTSVSDYMDWSLEQETTRVIALFLETVRNPAGFLGALEKANDRGIPVVVLKVGKSPLGAELAKTHTGAMTGDHAALEAVFRQYGVMEVGDFDEMAALLMLLQSARRPGPGELATIQESGGFMELVTDICHDLGIGFARIGQQTKDEIARHLEPGLKADNPLDAWGTNKDFEYRFYACIAALMRDPAVASGIFFANFRDGHYLAEAFFRAVRKVSQENEKPLAMANCYSDISHPELCRKAFEADIPFIDGAREALLATRHLYRHRDRLRRSPEKSDIALDPDRTMKWRASSGRSGRKPPDGNDRPGHVGGLRYRGTAAPQGRHPAASAGLRRGIRLSGGAQVPRTGLHHKTERNGVVPGIRDTEQLAEHYQDMETRLGAEALVCEQVAPGTEIGFGMVNDPQFGPFIMISAGGTQIELLADRAVALPPVSHAEVDEMLSSLKIDRLLRGIRGQPPGDRSGLIDSIVKLSHLAVALQDHVAEMDINPIIVNSGMPLPSMR